MCCGCLTNRNSVIVQGTKTPTDTGVFAFDSLQDKLQTLEALIGPVAQYWTIELPLNGYISYI